MTDFYARSLLILDVFGSQFVRLTPLWLAGVWVGATLVWMLTPRMTRWGSLPLSRLSVERPWRNLLLGSGLGVLSPFSLLSMLSLLRQLGRERRLRPYVLGYTLASPLLDPTMFTFTLLALGPRLAALRVLIALSAAWLAGLAIQRNLPVPVDASPTIGQPSRPLPERTVRGYIHHLGQHILFSGRYYLLALLLTAWIQVLLPLRSWFSAGRPGGLSEILFAAALGVPLYLCGGGAIALADGLLRDGLSQGAALAFLVVGAVTTPRALTGLVSLVGKRGAAILLSIVWGVAVLAALLLNALA